MNDKTAPRSKGWTGADIRNCCEVAWRLNISLVEASKFITPVSQSDPESIAKLRKMADGRFLSASYPGVYTITEAGNNKRLMEV